jgi:hypothetical protein
VEIVDDGGFSEVERLKSEIEILKSAINNNAIINNAVVSSIRKTDNQEVELLKSEIERLKSTINKSTIIYNAKVLSIRNPDQEEAQQRSEIDHLKSTINNNAIGHNAEISSIRKSINREGGLLKSVIEFLKSFFNKNAISYDVAISSIREVNNHATTIEIAKRKPYLEEREKYSESFPDKKLGNEDLATKIAGNTEIPATNSEQHLEQSRNGERKKQEQIDEKERELRQQEIRLKEFRAEAAAIETGMNLAEKITDFKADIDCSFELKSSSEMIEYLEWKRQTAFVNECPELEEYINNTLAQVIARKELALTNIQIALNATMNIHSYEQKIRSRKERAKLPIPHEDYL